MDGGAVLSNIQLVDNLYILRKAHGYTQQKISDKLNISRQAYSNYETSKRTPDLDLLVRLSQIYGISLDDLVKHTFATNGTVKENLGPFTPGLEIESGDTIYLTQNEVDVLKKYRTLSDEDKKIVDKFLYHQTE